MATNQEINYKFTWGEAVKVTADAPIVYLKAGKGCVCGIREIDTDNVASNFNEPIGTVLYLVECLGGDAIEIPECFLAKF